MSSCKVKNKLATPLTLNSATGDAIQIPGLASGKVPRHYIEFQAPSLVVAEVEGYDYVRGGFTDALSTPVEVTPVAPAAPTVTSTAEKPDTAPLRTQGAPHNSQNR